MKRRYIVGIIFYILAVIYFLSTFISAWYWSVAFALAPALIGYIIGGLFDLSSSKNQQEQPLQHPHYKWVFSIAVLVICLIAMITGFFGSVRDTLFGLGIVIYVIVPTGVAFVAGYIVDKLKSAN